MNISQESARLISDLTEATSQYIASYDYCDMASFERHLKLKTEHEQAIKRVTERIATLESKCERNVESESRW